MAAVAREPVIVADLAALEFIDSSGTAALVLACKQARRGGGDLRCGQHIATLPSA
jgi:anti-anti-sigma factor